MSERNPMGSQLTNYKLSRLEQRILMIEERLKINKDVPKATKTQKMLLLHHLGVLDKLKDLKLSKQKLAAIISILIDADSENIRKDLSTIEHPKSAMNTEANLRLLHEVFSEAGLSSKSKEIEALLDKLDR